MPNVLAVYSSKEGVKKAIVVQDALFCGVCRPSDDPVSLDKLE